MKGRFKRYDKLLIVLVLAIVCLTPAVALATNIDATRIVPCKVEPSVISMNITSDGQVDYGMLAPGETQDTTAAGVNDTQTARNDSTNGETVDFNIESSNAIKTVAEGTDWTLAAAAGADKFTHSYSTNSGKTWTKMRVAGDYYSLADDIDPGASQTFDLRIKMPTSTADYGEHTITATVLATAA